MEDDLAIPTVDVVLADELGFIGLIDGCLEALALADELAADIDVTGMSSHREGCDEAAFDKKVRIMPHDIPILAGAGLGLVCIDDEVMRPLLHLLRHEGPFESGRKSGTAAPAQAGLLDDIDDRFRTLLDDRLGTVPLAALLRGLESPVLETVEIGEDAILVGERHDCSSFNVVAPPIGSEVCRPICEPGLGVSPRRIASMIRSVFGPSRSS